MPVRSTDVRHLLNSDNIFYLHDSVDILQNVGGSKDTERFNGIVGRTNNIRFERTRDGDRSRREKNMNGNRVTNAINQRRNRITITTILQLL